MGERYMMKSKKPVEAGAEPIMEWRMDSRKIKELFVQLQPILCKVQSRKLEKIIRQARLSRERVDMFLSSVSFVKFATSDFAPFTLGNIVVKISYQNKIYNFMSFFNCRNIF